MIHLKRALHFSQFKPCKQVSHISSLVLSNWCMWERVFFNVWWIYFKKRHEIIYQIRIFFCVSFWFRLYSNYKGRNVDIRENNSTTSVVCTPACWLPNMILDSLIGFISLCTLHFILFQMIFNSNVFENEFLFQMLHGLVWLNYAIINALYISKGIAL